MPQTVPAETRTILDNVRWETYVALAEERCGSVPRLTYDRGLLELMNPRKDHEKLKTLLGRLVAAFADERELEIESVASTTFRREDLERGFEADESFYFQYAAAIRAKDEVDLTVDPAPELVIEIEITSSSIRKLELFAAMGVREVWRHDGSALTVHRLRDGKYETSPSSGVLPGFPVAAAAALVAQRRQRGEIDLVRDFRSSIRT